MVSLPERWTCCCCQKPLDKIDVPEEVSVTIVLCIKCGTLQIQDWNGYRGPKNADESMGMTLALFANFELITIARKAYLLLQKLAQ